MKRSVLSLSVVIPVFNEQKVVLKTVKEIGSILKKCRLKNYEIIAINDGSSDKSLKILTNLEKNKDLSRVINHDKNEGYGASLKDGIKSSKYDHILIIDADGTYPIQEIPDLVKMTSKFDMIIGARVKDNVHIPIERIIPKKIILLIARFLTGSNILDINSGMRIFSKKIALRYWHLFPNKWSMSSTLTLCSHLNNHNVTYVPISYKKELVNQH